MSLEENIKKQKAKNGNLRRKGEPQKVYNLLKDYNDKDSLPKGNKTSICTRCGKEFEQDYSPDRNAYSDWKKCPDCRKIISDKKEKKAKDKSDSGKIILPFSPYDWQKEAMDAFEKHRFTVLSCGNRTGYHALCIE